MVLEPKLVLASGSPRRTELLTQIGVAHRVQPADIDETPIKNEAAIDYVHRLALEKAQAIASQLTPDKVILAADTIVVIGGQTLGKPANAEHAKSMLKMLSGRTHHVYSATAVQCGLAVDVTATCTDVSFVEISDQQIDDYWLTGEQNDKAGGYAIQGFGAVFVEGIQGSYSNVVGLPIHTVCRQLKPFGIFPWNK